MTKKPKRKVKEIKMTDKSPMVFVVDDETSVLSSLTVLVKRSLGYDMKAFSSYGEAIDAISTERPDVIVTDIVMDGEEAGVKILQYSKDKWPEVPVIMMSAMGSREAAIHAVNAGAFYFLQKPFENNKLVGLLRTAVESGATRKKARALAAERSKPSGKHARSRRHNHPGAMAEREKLAERSVIIGESEAIMDAIALAEQAALSDVPVLFHGESGVGKSRFSFYLHKASPRAEKPFVEIKCGLLTESELDSSLFGEKEKDGAFQEVDGGTIAIGDVHELSLSTQGKLARALTEGEYLAPGEDKPLPVSARFVATTHKDLKKEVAAGRFREDLYWRLNVMPIWVPALRERKEDIPGLSDYILQQLKDKDLAKEQVQFSQEARDALATYEWPGNVQELENVIERAVVVSETTLIEPRDLPREVRAKDGRGSVETGEGQGGEKRAELGEGGLETGRVLGENGKIPSLAVIERAYVEWVIRRVGSEKMAADALGIPEVALRAILAAPQPEVEE